MEPCRYRRPKLRGANIKSVVIVDIPYSAQCNCSLIEALWEGVKLIYSQVAYTADTTRKTMAGLLLKQYRFRIFREFFASGSIANHRMDYSRSILRLWLWNLQMI